MFDDESSFSSIFEKPNSFEEEDKSISPATAIQSNKYFVSKAFRTFISINSSLSKNYIQTNYLTEEKKGNNKKEEKNHKKDKNEDNINSNNLNNNDNIESNNIFLKKNSSLSDNNIQPNKIILKKGNVNFIIEEEINKKDKNEDNINYNNLNNNVNINNLENAVSSTPQKIIKQNPYRAQYDRKKSMRKFNDSLFDYISFFASKLGLNLQKCYIKQLYGKNKDENALFIQKKIKDIIIESVPRRIPKKGNKMINKQLIEKLYNIEEIDEEK